MKIPFELKPTKGDAVIAAIAIVFSYLLLFKLPNIPIFSESDQLIFVYEGARLLHGDIMYRDFFQFTFPGTQTYYALVFYLFGENYWILPATVVLIGTCLSLVILRLSKDCINGYPAYLPSLIFLFFGWRWFGLDGSHRMFSPVFLLIGAYVLIRAGSFPAYAFVGFCCAVASFFTQQRGVIALAAFSIFLVLESWMRNETLRSAFYKIAIMSAAFLVALSALCFYFVYSAGFEEFLHAVFYYPSQFYKYVPANNYSVYADDLSRAASVGGLSGALFFAASLFYAVLLPLAVLTCLILFAARRKYLDWTEWRVPVLLALLSFLLFISTAGPGSVRFFQVGAPAIVLLVWMIARSGFVKRFEPQFAAVITVVLVAIGIVQILRMQTHWDMTATTTPSGRIAFVTQDQARFYTGLAERTQKGEYAFQAVQPYIYFPLGLKNPTRYAQIWQSDYTRPEHVEDVVRDLKAKNPQFIVWNNNYNLPNDLRRSDDHTGPLSEYVLKHYEPVGEAYRLEEHELQVWQLCPTEDYSCKK